MCKDCHNLVSRINYLKNRDKILKRTKKYAKENKERMRPWYKQYYAKNKTRLIKLGDEYRKRRSKTDYGYKMLITARNRIAAALHRRGLGKVHRTLKYLGCTKQELREHLESQFAKGMSWDNRSLWHIDHIIPLALFDLADVRQQEVAFHVTNLQPLWAHENLKKGGR